MAQLVPRFRGGQPLAQQITATTLNRIVDELNSLRLINVSGGTFTKLPNGTSLNLMPFYGGAAAQTSFAFELIDASTESGGVTTYKIRTRFGTLNGVTPSNMSAGDAPTCVLTLPVTGDQSGYIYLEGLFDPDVTTPATVDSCEVKIADGTFTPLPIVVANYWKLQVVLGTYNLTGSTFSIAQAVKGSIMAVKRGFSFAWGNS